jgi:hypothetical protein
MSGSIYEVNMSCSVVFESFLHSVFLKSNDPLKICDDVSMQQSYSEYCPLSEVYSTQIFTPLVTCCNPVFG